MLTNPRLKAHEDVNLYLKSTGQDAEYLFILAYVAFYGKADVEVIKANVKRYELTDDPPYFVRYFLSRSLS